MLLFVDRGVALAQQQNNRQLRKDCAAILESMKVWSIYTLYAWCLQSSLPSVHMRSKGYCIWFVWQCVCMCLWTTGGTGYKATIEHLI